MEHALLTHPLPLHRRRIRAVLRKASRWYRNALPLAQSLLRGCVIAGVDLSFGANGVPCLKGVGGTIDPYDDVPSR